MLEQKYDLFWRMKGAISWNYLESSGSIQALKDKADAQCSEYLITIRQTRSYTGKNGQEHDEYAASSPQGESVWRFPE